MSYEYGLISVDNTQSSKILNIVRDNIISFYDWGFLDKGGFQNINSPASGMYGGNKNQLKLVKDENYQDGQVWQSFRKNWVWETGVSTNTQPIAISGITKNNTFLPYSYNSSSGFYCGSGYRIDYPQGRIIFDTAIPTTSNVSLNYSYKWVAVDKSDAYPFFQQIQQGSFRLNENFFTGSGLWNQLSQTRVQLPAVIINTVPNTNSMPLQLGGGQWLNIDVMYYVIAETESSCSNLASMILYQNNRVIKLFDTNSVYQSGSNPLSYRGDLKSKSYDYRYLVDNHFYRNTYIKNTTLSNVTQLTYDLYISTARSTLEIQMPSLR